MIVQLYWLQLMPKMPLARIWKSFLCKECLICCRDSHTVMYLWNIASFRLSSVLGNSTPKIPEQFLHRKREGQCRDQCSGDSVWSQIRIEYGKSLIHWGVILRLLLTCQAGDEGKQAKHMEKESDHHGHQGHWWQKHGSNNTRKHQPWFPGKDHYCCFHVVVYLHLGRHALCFCQR